MKPKNKLIRGVLIFCIYYIWNSVPGRY